MYHVVCCYLMLSFISFLYCIMNLLISFLLIGFYLGDFIHGAILLAFMTFLWWLFVLFYIYIYIYIYNKSLKMIFRLVKSFSNFIYIYIYIYTRKFKKILNFLDIYSYIITYYTCTFNIYFNNYCISHLFIWVYSRDILIYIYIYIFNILSSTCYVKHLRHHQVKFL